MRKSYIIFYSILLLIGNVLYAQPPGTGWTLKWSDDFNGTAVDTVKWKIDDNKTRSADNNKTCYERENVVVSGGTLKLIVKNTGCDCAGTIYSGGNISSTGSYYNNKYGYYEARLRYNCTGPGFWGNFWMSSTEGWPPEFDNAEMISNNSTTMSIAYHYYDANNVHKATGAKPADDWKQWHVYGVEWLEGQPLRFYIDGVKVCEPSASTAYPPNEKMNVILRMGAYNSSTWGGIPDGTTVWPGNAEYDWIKVWEKTGAPANNPPVVAISAPVNNSTFSAPANVNITATASDADGSVTKVEFYNGSSKLGEDLSSPYAYAWSNISAGTYSITTKATDNSGNTKTSSPVTITVINNTAVNDVWIETFTGLIDSTQIDNGPTAWTSTRSDGTFDVISNEFSITDAGGEGVWTSQLIDISKYSSVDFSIDVQGVGALDAGGATMDYIKIYYVLNGGAEVSVLNHAGVFADENYNTYSVKGLKGTSIKIIIRALTTGGGEYYYWDNVKITTADKINNAPIVSITDPGNGEAFTAPATVDIAATATDADGSITKVEFYNGTTKLGEDASSPYRYSWTNAQAGTFTLIAKAYDNSGNVQSSLPVSISVSAPVVTSDLWYEPFTGLADSTKVDNGSTAWTSTRSSGVFEVIANEFSITDAGGEGVWTSQVIDISMQSSVDFSIDIQGMGALDASGGYLDYIKVYYVINGGAETALLQQNGSFGNENWNTYTKKGLSGNTLKIVVRALISGGDEYYYWDNIRVFATPKTNTPPTVNLLIPIANTELPPATVSIAATATDADGSIIKVEFYNGNTKIGEDYSSPYSFLWNAVADGTYTITAKAIDNNGASTVSSSQTVTVKTTNMLESVFSSVEIYPTQTSGIVYITNAEKAQYSVVSSSGMVCKLAIIENGAIDLSDLPAGMYILQIIMNNELRTEKIVKK